MFRSYRDTIRTPTKPQKQQPERVFSCDFCTDDGNIWFSENDVEIHRKKAHHTDLVTLNKMNRSRFCTVCMRLQNSKEDLLKHVKELHLLSSPSASRIERKIFICDECNHIFFNKDLLAAHTIYAHMNKTENNKNRLFTCPKCYQNVRVKAMWFHFQKHEIPNVSACDICLESFNNREELYNHVKSHKLYLSCEQCSYQSTKKELFDAHINMHSIKTVQISCTKINKHIFKSYKPLQTYKYNIHSTLKGLGLPYFINVCVLCRALCMSNEEMVVHVMKNHVDAPLKKNFHICSCGKEFEYQVMLKQHIHQLKGNHTPMKYTEVPASNFENVSSEGTSDNEINNDSEENINEFDIKILNTMENRNIIEIELTPVTEVSIGLNNMQQYE